LQNRQSGGSPDDEGTANPENLRLGQPSSPVMDQRRARYSAVLGSGEYMPNYRLRCQIPVTMAKPSQALGHMERQTIMHGIKAVKLELALYKDQ